MPTEAGTKNWPPAPVSPGFLLERITMYRHSFPLLALAAVTCKSDKSGPSGSELMRFPLSMTAGMAGYIVEEQAAAAAGVAEERRSDSGRFESVPHRLHSTSYGAPSGSRIR